MMIRRWRYLLIIAFGICTAIGVFTFILLQIFHTGHIKVMPNFAQLTATAITINARQVVQNYNQAVVKQDWATLYSLTSQSIVSNYTEEEFAQLMVQQVQQVGSISTITPTSQPVVKTDPDGTTYFVISEKVTISRNGISSTQSMISVYILESGTWKFWFSK